MSVVNRVRRCSITSPPSMCGSVHSQPTRRIHEGERESEIWVGKQGDSHETGPGVDAHQRAATVRERSSRIGSRKRLGLRRGTRGGVAIARGRQPLPHGRGSFRVTERRYVFTARMTSLTVRQALRDLGVAILAQFGEQAFLLRSGRDAVGVSDAPSPVRASCRWNQAQELKDAQPPAIARAAAGATAGPRA